MSHVNDAKRLAQYQRLLGEPRSLTRVAQVGGRRPLDTCNPGQQEFQALLLWCLFSPLRSLRWDTKGGRSFRAMQDYYSWVSPQQEYLATGWTVAERVASYLLPDFKSHRDIQGGDLRFSGIPGLRVAGFTKQTICLKHLPTGGMLRLYSRGLTEGRATKARDLESEAGRRAARAQSNLALPLWKSEKISREEGEGLADWSLAKHAPALSAVMARIHAILHYNTDAELDINPTDGCPRLSWWGRPSLTSFEALLTSDALMRVDGARSVPVGRNSRMLHVDGAALELRGPFGDD